MTLRQRYAKLTLWNKVGFWGALASCLGLLLAVYTFVVPASSSPHVETSDRGVAAGGDVTVTAAPKGHAVLQTGIGTIKIDQQETQQ